MFSGRDNEFSSKIYGQSVDTCEACAAECVKFDTNMCKQCVQVCRQCSKISKGFLLFIYGLLRLLARLTNSLHKKRQLLRL